MRAVIRSVRVTDPQHLELPSQWVGFSWTIKQFLRGPYLLRLLRGEVISKLFGPKVTNSCEVKIPSKGFFLRKHNTGPFNFACNIRREEKLQRKVNDNSYSFSLLGSTVVLGLLQL